MCSENATGGIERQPVATVTWLHRDTLTSNDLTPVQIGWIAGVWDGEGSVGAFKTSKTNIGPQVQMSMTCAVTIEYMLSLFSQAGIAALRYVYTEKKSHHKDAHLVHTRRVYSCYQLASLVGPFSITKKQQWQLVKELCEIKLSRGKLNSDGKLVRTPGQVIAITPREFEIYRILRSLNYRTKE